MQKFLLTIAALILCCGGGFASDKLAARAVKTEKPPNLDGQLDEAFWQSAPPLGEFHVFAQTITDQRVNDTEIRLAYDDTWLYAGVKCDNPQQQLVSEPKVINHDDSVNDDESVELFLDSDGTGKIYYHFLLSCFNVKAEQRFMDGNRERQSWNLPWRSATAITDNGWSAEIAIPLYLFLEFGDLEHIRLNIARNRRIPFMDEQMVSAEKSELSMWRPVQRQMHEPGSFGRLAPLAPGKLKMPFMPALERVEIQPYFIKDGTNYFRVETSVKGANTESGLVEMVVTDQPVGSEPRTVKTTFTQDGTATTPLVIDVPAPSPSARTITVALRDAARGETLQTRVIANPPVLNIMAAYLHRNYYTTEETATAVAEIALPPLALQDLQMAVMHAGKILGKNTAAPVTMVRFPLDKLPVGRHPLVIVLQKGDGSPFFSLNAELIKRPPQPGGDWKIDRIDRVLLTPAGAPVFPFGPVMSGIGPDDEADFQAIDAAGCNTFFQWCDSTNTAAYLTMAEKHGLYVMMNLETDGYLSIQEADLKLPAKLLPPAQAKLLMPSENPSRLQRSKRGPKILLSILTHGLPAASLTDKQAIFDEYLAKTAPRAVSFVNGLKNHPNLMGWISVDEPYDGQPVPYALNKLYDLTCQADGYHPVFMLYSSYIPEGDGYLTGTDILATDPYWIPAMNPEEYNRGSPNYVSQIVYWNDQRAIKFRQPVWIMPAGALYSGMVRSKRIISGPEQHCQNFLAIIHGARGLFWFDYGNITASAYAWENLKESMAMIKVIGPMAVQPQVKQDIRHTRAAAPDEAGQAALFQPEKSEFPDVQGRIFRNPQGGLVLVAANSRYYPVNAAFTVAGLTGTVARLFGPTVLPVKDGAFTEALEPFAVRAYRLNGPLAEPVQLTIAALRPPEIPPRETALPHNCRPGRKNVFPNPSFEETTLPGLADYYFFDGIIAPPDVPAKFGKQCLQVTKNKRGYQFGWRCAPQHEQDTPYVFSFYAKGAKGGEKILLRRHDKTITVTADWQRYEVPVVIPPRLGLRDDQAAFYQIYVITPDDTVWFDGLQLEQGYQATEFEE